MGFTDDGDLLVSSMGFSVMGNLIKIERETDVKQTLEECLELADSLQGVIVIGLTKETSQFIRTSTMNAMEKAFCIQFANAWLNKWFEWE